MSRNVCVAVLPRKDDMIGFRKEASGLCLFHKLHGVQVVGGSNSLTPISIQIQRFVRPRRGGLSPKTVEFTVVA